jgi:hypothetical protein
MSDRQLRPSPDDKGFRVDPAVLIRLGDGSLDKGRAQLRLLLADEIERLPIKGPVRKPGGVRLAVEADEPALLRLVMEDLAENATQVAPASEARILENLQVATRGKGGFCPVIDGADGPVALALLVPTQWWWSTNFFLSETFMYVSPPARRSRAATRLLQYECWLADTMSVELDEPIFVLAGVTATKRQRAKMRLYRRHMNQVGGFFCFPAIEGLSL